MIDSGSRSQVRPLESFKRSRIGLLAITSFIIHSLEWRACNRSWGNCPMCRFFAQVKQTRS